MQAILFTLEIQSLSYIKSRQGFYIQRSGVCWLVNGVVIDILEFFKEYDDLSNRGIDLDGRIGVSQRAHLLMPHHLILDRISEDEAKHNIGTTGRGIGPAYQEKVSRVGIRVADLYNYERARSLVEESAQRAQEKIASMGIDVGKQLDSDLESTLAARQAPSRLGYRHWSRNYRCNQRRRTSPFGGSPRHRLLISITEHIPFVTSSNTTAAAAATGSGIGPTEIDTVIGVVKAYTTRVGNGPLPTAFDAAMNEKMRTLGNEFGATTGRPRRCGWFDAVLARFSARVNGLTGLAVTKLDVLDTLSDISIATSYRTPEGIVEEFPANTWGLDDVEPIYETLPGWCEPTNRARTIEDLPAPARRYLDRIEELTGTPLRMISVGTRRSQIIMV